MAQIELGDRNVDVFELFRLSQVLGFSLDVFLSPDFKTNEVLQYEQPKTEEKSDLRVSAPDLKVNKFKNV